MTTTRAKLALVAMAIIYIAIVAASICLGGCRSSVAPTIQDPPQSRPAADPVSDNGQASGMVESLQADTQDAALSVAEDAARLEAVIEDAKAGWQTVCGKASEIVGSLRRTAAVLKAKDAQLAAARQHQADAEKAIQEERRLAAEALTKSRGETATAIQERDDARSDRTKWADLALQALIVLGVICLAGGGLLATAFTAFARLGKGIILAGGILVIGAGGAIAYLGVTEQLVPWIVYGAGATIVMAVIAVGWAFWQHRQALSSVVKSVDAATAATPSIGTAFRTIARQIQTRPVEALVKKYQTPNELPKPGVP